MEARECWKKFMQNCSGWRKWARGWAI